MSVKTILLVEDNPDDATLTRRALVKSGIDAAVTLAEDGVDAIKFVESAEPLALKNRAELPDLVLLDLKLPKVDGFEVLGRMKSKPSFKSVPVVVLTSSGEESDIARCYELGANSYIQKPVDFSEFMETMKEISTYWLSINWSLKSSAEQRGIQRWEAKYSL